MVKLPKKIVSLRKRKPADQEARPALHQTLQFDDRKWRDGPSVLQLEETSDDDLAGGDYEDA